MPKNLVVTNCPFSAYHCGSASLAGSSVNAPRGCLSMPTAIPMSYFPNRIVSAHNCVALAPVAQAVNTAVKGSARDPDQPCPRVRIAPFIAAADTELNVLPLEPRIGQGGLDRLRAHLHRGLVEPAERVKTHADDRDIAHNDNSSALHRTEGERHDLVALVVGGERDHGQLDVHAELKLCRIVLGESPLDADPINSLYAR